MFSSFHWTTTATIALSWREKEEALRTFSCLLTGVAHHPAWSRLPKFSTRFPASQEIPQSWANWDCGSPYHTFLWHSRWFMWSRGKQHREVQSPCEYKQHKWVPKTWGGDYWEVQLLLCFIVKFSLHCLVLTSFHHSPSRHLAAQLVWLTMHVEHLK